MNTAKHCSNVQIAPISSKIWRYSNNIPAILVLNVVLLDSQDANTGNRAVNIMDENGTNWTEFQTLLLIDCYKRYVSLVHSGKMKKNTMWDTIGSKFQDMRYGFSSEQICGRLKSLMRAYKNTKDSNKKSGSCRKTFEYEDQLDELFAKDPTI